jgi:methyl-accepting chemotaxis protein
MDKKIGYRWQFIGSLIVVSLIAIICYVCLAHSYRQRLDRIEEIQVEDGKQLTNLFKTIPYNNRALAVETDKISRTLEDHEQRMESLMELEFEKLQNDFNFISLWAGIITIVFLIFSIYSIFKTDEMLKKSETVYEKIKRNAEVIGDMTKSIQSKYQEELGTLKKGADDYMNEMAQKMTLLNERLANADTLIRQHRETAQIDEVVQTSTEEQDVQEKNETT